MITIVEDQPKKLSGLTSLFISFPFNQDAINVIKTLDKYNYDKKTYTWEVPITSLAYLLDELTYLDDISLQLKKDEDKGPHYYPKTKDKYKTPPMDHQLEGIEYGLNINNWLLLDDPGLGKTLQMIYLAQELKEQKGLEHCLIICGINSLKTNWEKEIAKHSDLSYHVLGKRLNKKGRAVYGTIQERAAELMEPLNSFFIITNIETIRNDDVIQALKTTKNKIDMVIVDEIHKIKNPTSQQGHNLLKLSDYRFKVGLTGTLIMNKPIDAFSALKWIGAEKATLTNFKGQYCVFGGFGGHQVVGYKNLDILKDEISSCSLRRTKDMLKNLPPKTVIVETLEMEDGHLKFYESVKNGVKESCDKINLNPNNVLALTTRLREATTSPGLLTTEHINSTKLNRAVDLIEEIVESGEKVVVMSTFKEPLKELMALIPQYKPLLGSGDVSDDEFSRNIDLFQNDDKYKVFLGTTSKAGTGITLNKATYMICLDQPWTSALQQQVEDRIHRVNNTKPVFIYKLVCQGTIDELVNRIVDTKKAISEFIVDDKADENAIKLLREYISDL